MHRLFTLWLWINAVLSGIAVAAPLSVMVFTDLQLIVPGTSAAPCSAEPWAFSCTSASGSSAPSAWARPCSRACPAPAAWIVAGLVPLLLGAWWRINYPDDADGNLIFSPQAWELDYAMAIGCGLVFSGLYWYRRGRLKPRPVATSADVLLPRTVGALILAGVFLLPPLNFIKQQALPNCAFNKAGQQLTVCLGDDPNEQVIVD